MPRTLPHLICCLAGLAAAWSACGPAWAHNLAFELSTSDGQRVELQPGVARATAVVFLGTQCPMARGYASQLNELHRELLPQGGRVVGIMSNRQDSADDIARYAAELRIEFPLVHDVGNLLADRYGATRTPEAFLLDENLNLRYRGRIDDQLSPGVTRSAATRHDLQIAVREVLAGKPVSIPATTALGCLIGRVASESPPATAPGEITYSNQVARILQQHCTECHRSGEIGPFAMDSFEEVVGWAETMLETIDQGRMPPWHADPRYGDFANQRQMPEADKQTLRDWVAAGMPRGSDDRLPVEPPRIAGWDLPQPPDLVVDMRSRPFVVPKEGVVEYQYFVADPGLTEDTWVSAAQVIPGSAAVVHHAIVFVRPPDGSEFRGIGWLAGYVPGQRTHAFPPGRARKIPAGSKLVFQMHYTPNGAEQADVTRVGLVFAEADQVSHEVFTLMAINQEFEIPPGAAEHVVQAQTGRLPSGSELLAITPHMHVRGKAFRVLAGDAAGETLLHVPRYDFNWQHTYQLAKPLPLDDISHFTCQATFDNSADNPFNPDPGETVSWGDQTWEEMAVAFFEVSRPLGREPGATAGQSPDASETPGETSAAASVRRAKIEAYIERVFEALDANGDGVIKKAEADIVVRHMHFELWDLNRDNLATLDEVRQVAENLF